MTELPDSITKKISEAVATKVNENYHRILDAYKQDKYSMIAMMVLPLIAGATTLTIMSFSAASQIPNDEIWEPYGIISVFNTTAHKPSILVNYEVRASNQTIFTGSGLSTLLNNTQYLYLAQFGQHNGFNVTSASIGKLMNPSFTLGGVKVENFPRLELMTSDQISIQLISSATISLVYCTIVFRRRKRVLVADYAYG